MIQYVFLTCAAILFVFVAFRTRKRANTQADNAANPRRSNLSSTVPLLENQSVKMLELSREIEARFQNKIQLMQAMLDDADKKIAELQSQINGKVSTPEPVVVEEKPAEVKKNNGGPNPIYEQVANMEREGKSDHEIGAILNRSEGEVKLLRSLVKHSSTND